MFKRQGYTAKLKKSWGKSNELALQNKAKLRGLSDKEPYSWLYYLKLVVIKMVLLE